MSLATYTRREIQRRPGRTILTFLGIAIGVAAIVGVWITIGTTRRVYREMFEMLTGRAALEVVSDGLAGFDPSIISKLKSVEGVKEAVPVIQGPAAFVTPKGSLGVIVLGIDPKFDGAVRDYDFNAGRQIESFDEVLLSSSFAEAHALGVGDTVRLIAPTGFASMKIVGVLKPQGAAAVSGGLTVFVSLEGAQKLFGMKDRVNSINVVLDPKSNEAEVQSRIAAVLPAGLSTQKPSSRGELAQEGMLSTEQALSTLSAVSLVAGAFVILNTFLMNLSERRRQIAILRALGATRNQVTRLLLREAAILGVLGTFGGIAAGVAIATLLARVMTRYMGIKYAGLDLSPEPFILALIAGPGMALVSTFFPARRESARPPLEGLIARREDRKRSGNRWQGWLGLAILVVNHMLLAVFLLRWLPATIMTPILPLMMSATLIGCVLAVPLMLPPLTRLVAWGLAPFLGIEGRLAMRQLARRRTRTGLTVGVLFIAIAVAVGMGNTLLNSINDVEDWYDGNLSADYFIRAMMPDMGMVLTAALPDGLEPELASVPGVEHVGKISFLNARSGARRVMVLAITFEPDRPLSLSLHGGDPQEVLQRLLQGEVVVAMTLAHELGVKAGDSIQLETPKGPKNLRVAATSTEYTVGGLALFMDWKTSKELLGAEGVGAYLISAKKGSGPSPETVLRALCKEKGYLFQSNADLRLLVENVIRGVVGFLWLLMSLVFVVASLGIVNTLTMNVLEQTREVAVLRAIAMRRREVRKMVLAQAIGIGLISLIPGSVAGLGISYMANLASGVIYGRPLKFELEVPFILTVCLAGMVIAVGSAFAPARRAAGLRIIQALHYE